MTHVKKRKSKPESRHAKNNRSPAPHLRPIRPPHIANYSSEACFNEPEALDVRLQARVMQSFDMYR